MPVDCRCGERTRPIPRKRADLTIEEPSAGTWRAVIQLHFAQRALRKSRRKATSLPASISAAKRCDALKAGKERRQRPGAVSRRRLVRRPDHFCRNRRLGSCLACRRSDSACGFVASSLGLSS